MYGSSSSFIEKAQATVKDAVWSAQMQGLKYAVGGLALILLLQYHEKRTRQLRQR